MLKVSKQCIEKELNKPFRSKKLNKKFDVCVKDKEGNVKKISFGDNRFKDYTQHKDKKRRTSFRARHKCDSLTKKDMDTPRWWACEFLWS